MGTHLCVNVRDQDTISLVYVRNPNLDNNDTDNDWVNVAVTKDTAVTAASAPNDGPQQTRPLELGSPTGIGAARVLDKTVDELGHLGADLSGLQISPADWDAHRQLPFVIQIKGQPLTLIPLTGHNVVCLAAYSTNSGDPFRLVVCL